MKNKNKVSIIGSGAVGSTVAFTLATADFLEEIVLIDINKKMAQAQAMDLQHSLPFLGNSKIKAGEYKDLQDSRIVVITCGAGRKPGQTRLDLAKINVSIIKEIIPKIFEQNPDIIIVVVSNPVDIMTYSAVKMFPKKKNQIIGTGTLLDTARFHFLLSEHLKVDPQSISAYIVGEHGESAVPLWTSANSGNAKLNISPNAKKEIFNKVKNIAATVIEGKGVTNFAIAAGVGQMVKAILFDKKTVFPASHLMEGEFGIKDICLSLPVVLGKNGIIARIKPDISAVEKKLLQVSAKKLKQVVKGL